jgi:hypothetical protein
MRLKTLVDKAYNPFNIEEISIGRTNSMGGVTSGL